MPIGLGWEDPYPDASSGLGDGEEDGAAAAAAAAAAQHASAGASASPPPSSLSPRKQSKSGGGGVNTSTGARSDGRKTSTSKAKKTRSSKKATGSSSRRKHASSSGAERPEPLRTAGTAAEEGAAAAAASGASAGAVAAAGPEQAEDDAPSPHKSSRSRACTSTKPQSKRSGTPTKSRRGAPPPPPPPPRSSPSNGTPTSRSTSRPSRHRSSSSSNNKKHRPRSSGSSGSGRQPSGSPRRSRTSPSRSDRNLDSNGAAAVAAATAAAAAAAAAATAAGPLISPTDTDGTRETSHDSWRENGSSGSCSGSRSTEKGGAENEEDIEAGAAAAARSPPSSSSPPAKRSHRDKPSAGRSGSRSKSSRPKSSSSGGKHGKGGRSSSSRNHRSSNGHGRANAKGSSSSSSRRHTSRSRRKYDYVSCCGWEWKKTHLLGLAVAVILVAGGAVAALLFTGILGTGGGGGSASQASDFSSVTASPTVAPTEESTEDFSVLSSGDGSRPNNDNVGSRPTPRPTRWEDGDNDSGSGGPKSDMKNQPTASEPTISPMPTSCTESTDLFKYFDDAGSVITTNCKKVALSTEDDEVKCQRTVVFGGGFSVRDLCPTTCGGCQFLDGGDDGALAPTDRPTAFTLEPTPAPKPVAVPTLATTPSAGSNPSESFLGHDTFSFYVMGDIPYMYKQELTLIEQLQDQTNTLDPKEEIFQVHVGDIQNPKRSQCASSHFDKIAGYYKTYSKIPNLMLPGDNDWNDCPNPDLAWQYWETNFVPFEQYWSDISDFPSTVMRQSGQRENFAFVRGGVLFLGLNLVGGQTNDFVTNDDWDRLIDNDIAWAQFHMDRLNVGSPKADPTDEDYIRAVIIFGHSPRGRRFNNFLMQRLYNSNLPVVYIHGNGHTYEAVQPFLSDGWANYWRIQVDQGFNAPPAKVTVRGTTSEALRLSMSINGGKVFPGGFIKLDRRGGLYEGAVATDADGNPLISGVGGG